MEQTKICSKCGKERPVSEFSPNGQAKADGVRPRKSYCKICASEAARHWYQENRNRVLTKKKERYGREKERLKKESREWYWKNHARCLAVKSEWRRKNKREYTEVIRRWTRANRFRIAINSSRNAAKRLGYSQCTATVKEIEAAFTGYCHVCGLSESEHNGKLHMDHDHETGEFRGWLCRSCNAKDALATKLQEKAA